MSVLKIFLKDRAVIYCSGSDLFSFFHRMFTQDFLNFSVDSRSFGADFVGSDVVKSSDFNCGFVDSSSVNYALKYSLFLNPQGTCLYDFFVYKINDEACFLDINASQVESFITTINKYKFRSDVNLKLTNKKVVSYLSIDSQGSSGLHDFLKNEKSHLKSHSNKDQDANKCEVIGEVTGVDPRCSKMGLRGISSSGNESSNEEINSGINGVEIYKIMQMLCNLPNFVNGLIPVECNMKEINAIAFGKGCYIGQEFTNRTHTSGVVRKKLSVAVILSYNEKLSCDENILNSGVLCDENDCIKSDELRCDLENGERKKSEEGVATMVSTPSGMVNMPGVQNTQNVLSMANKNELKCVYLNDKKIMNFKETMQVNGKFLSEILMNSKLMNSDLFSNEDSCSSEDCREFFGEISDKESSEKDSSEGYGEKHMRILNKLRHFCDFGSLSGFMSCEDAESSENNIQNTEENARLYLALGLVNVEYIDKVVCVNKDNQKYIVYSYNVSL